MSGTSADPFFWNDWQGSVDLRLCSMAARGLWMYMLCIAAEANPKGYVLIRSKNPSAKQFAQVVGATEDEIRMWVSELESAGVFSRTRSGVIYSRRMVRMTKVRDHCSKMGKIGGRVTHEKRLGIHAQSQKVSDVDRDETCVSRARAPSPSPSPSPDRKKKEEEKMKGNGHASVPPSPKDDILMAFETFNEAAQAARWPKAQRLSETRKRQLAKRLEECGGISGWQAAMAKALASDFLTGRSERGVGHESWSPDLDFFLQPKSFTQLMEGKYDNRRSASKPTKFDNALAGGALFLAEDGKADVYRGTGTARPAISESRHDAKSVASPVSNLLGGHEPSQPGGPSVRMPPLPDKRE